jgi:hypothetical protein
LSIGKVAFLELGIVSHMIFPESNTDILKHHSTNIKVLYTHKWEKFPEPESKLSSTILKIPDVCNLEIVHLSYNTRFVIEELKIYKSIN